MATTMLLNKITDVCVDAPCCAGFSRGPKTNNSEEISAEESPVKTNTRAINTPAPKNQTTRTKKSKFVGKASKYESQSWSSLPQTVKKACTTLGYDQEKWDGAVLVDMDYYHWHDLSQEQVDAVTTLGWDKDAWEHKYEDTNFKDLPGVVQEAAKELGFTEEMWDGNQWPQELNDGAWDDLSDYQTLALNVIGWTKQKWD